MEAAEAMGVVEATEVVNATQVIEATEVVKTMVQRPFWPWKPDFKKEN